MNNMGSVTISLDTELGWGSIANGKWIIREKNLIYDTLRSKVKDLINALDQYNFPCTWAIVGAMIDEKRDLDYPNMMLQKSIVSAYKSGKNSSFDGRDILDIILNAKIKHEIAWHTYYHIPFNLINLEYVKIDLEKAKELSIKYEIELSSLVFPLNIEKHHEILKTMGINVCRGGAKESSFLQFSRKIRQGYKLYKLLFSTPPESFITYKSNNLLHITGSMLLKPPFHSIRLLKLYEKWAMKCIDMAVKKKKHIHFWVHPFDLIEYPKLYESSLKIIQYAASKRDNQQLQILTMRDFNEIYSHLETSRTM